MYKHKMILNILNIHLNLLKISLIMYVVKFSINYILGCHSLSYKNQIQWYKTSPTKTAETNRLSVQKS